MSKVTNNAAPLSAHSVTRLIFVVMLLLFKIAVSEARAAKTDAPIETEETTTAPIGQIKVKVYYETLCPDSMTFIRNQVYGAMITNDWLKYTNLSFVPYGKVSSWTDPVTSKVTLYCQHGVEECDLNAMHACIVENNSIEEQVKMFRCMMKSHENIINKCAEKLGINVTAALQCKMERKTADILTKYGIETQALDLTFVPSITFDDKFDPWHQQTYFYQFNRVFCRKYKQKFNIDLDQC